VGHHRSNREPQKSKCLPQELLEGLQRRLGQRGFEQLRDPERRPRLQEREIPPLQRRLLKQCAFYFEQITKCEIMRFGSARTVLASQRRG
jgi:hypothetical protein